MIEALAIMKSSDRPGEDSRRGRWAGDFPGSLSFSLSSALRRPRLGLVSGSSARSAKSSSAATPSRPSSLLGSPGAGTWVQYTCGLFNRYSKNASTCIACIQRCEILVPYSHCKTTKNKVFPLEKGMGMDKTHELGSYLQPYCILLNLLGALTFIQRWGLDSQIDRKLRPGFDLLAFQF